MEAPWFVEPMQNIETTVGETVRFTCKAAGTPAPTFTWFKNDKEISLKNEHFTIEYNKENGETSLLVTNVQPDHDDTYCCLATNPAGSDKCKAELFVEGLLFK